MCEVIRGGKSRGQKGVGRNNQHGNQVARVGKSILGKSEDRSFQGGGLFDLSVSASNMFRQNNI